MLGNNFSYSLTANDAHLTASHCAKCACDLERLKANDICCYYQRWDLSTFYCRYTGTFPKAKCWSKFLIVITNSYFKLTRAVSTLNTVTLHTAISFFDQRNVADGMPDFLLEDVDSPPASRRVETLHRFLVAKHTTTTTYDPQTSESQEKQQKTCSALTALRRWTLRWMGYILSATGNFLYHSGASMREGILDESSFNTWYAWNSKFRLFVGNNIETVRQLSAYCVRACQQD